MARKNFLKSSLQNASFSIILQIVSRFVTFAQNAFVLRHVSQAIVGVIHVRLLLLESTILFLSREAFRRACLSKTSEHNWIQVINLIWLTVPLCLVLSAIFGYIWIYFLTAPSSDITEHYTLGVYAICLSCLIEICSEPLYLVSQAFLFVKFKVAVDIIYMFVRTFTFSPLVFYWPDKAIVAFSFAQVLAVCIYTLSHYVYFYYYIHKLNKTHSKSKETKSNSTDSNTAESDFPFVSMFDFLPSRARGMPHIDYSLARLTWSFFKQGILKQVLTEGEKYIMTVFDMLSFADQGVYDIVNNLSSLAARLVFRPIEDSSYFYFSQMVRRDMAVKDQDQELMAESANVLCRVLRCITCIGLVILVFGQSYSTLLLYLYGGVALISGLGPLLMRTHCFEVLLLAVNGITECYTSATMSAAQLDHHNYVIATLSVLFLVFSWVFTKWLGAVGFILANCCNMAFRTAHSVQFIKNRYCNSQYKPLVGLTPGANFLITLLISGVITYLSEQYLFEQFKLLHLIVGVICFASVLASWIYTEREMVSLALKKWQGTKED